MKNLLFSMGTVVVLSGSLPVLAQKYSRFHEHPSERQAAIESFARKAAEDKKEAKAWAKLHGKKIRFEHNGKLYELAEVLNGKPVYYTTFNYNAAISTAADQLRNTVPYNLNGAGITVGVWDGGSVRNTHQEFGNRVSLKDPSTAFGDHGTHVAGTIGASGGFQFGKTGMVPSALIDSYDWSEDLTELTGAAASAPGEPTKLYLSNHSYGYTIGREYPYGEYWSKPASMDQIVHNNEYFLPFISAGNEQSEVAGGFGTVSSYGVAKNTITIGAVNDAVSGASRSLLQATMSGFSSWGPVDDGRIKPDVVANGVGVSSTSSASDSSYVSKNGTSMASPNACGSAALLVEYYKELLSGGAMRASTLKGLIIHTANDLGNVGPDYKFGWGLMNTKAAADILQEYAGGSLNRLTEETVTAAAPSDDYLFQWNGTDPIRVTLCWTDPAGTASTSDDDRVPDLVNDLDLRITKAGATYYPYKLSYASPASNATTGNNDVDNVEQVYIATPSAGFYTATVNYEGSLTGSSQRYSLIITGDSGDADSDNIPDSWETIYFGGATNAIATADTDGDGADNLTEYVSGHDPTDFNSVFKVVTYEAPVAASNVPFIVTWDPIAGRVYNVSWNHNLLYGSFTNISGDLPYPANSYTDSVERVPPPNFYRIDVRLGQ